MRKNRKKRWKKEESPTKPPAGPWAGVEADEDNIIAQQLNEDDTTHPLRPQVMAALAGLMEVLGIAKSGYISEPQQGTLSLKERVVFREREARDRALAAASSTLRITRTEYIETEDKITKEISPFRHGFVMVADCPPEGRTRHVAHHVMIDALERAKNTRLCKDNQPQ